MADLLRLLGGWIAVAGVVALLAIVIIGIKHRSDRTRTDATIAVSEKQGFSGHGFDQNVLEIGPFSRSVSKDGTQISVHYFTAWCIDGNVHLAFRAAPEGAPLPFVTNLSMRLVNGSPQPCALYEEEPFVSTGSAEYRGESS